MKLFTPNEHLSARDRMIVNYGTIITIIMIWLFFNSTLLPKPQEVFLAGVDLIKHKGLLRDFSISIGLCLKGILIATIISMIIAYLATIPILKSFSFYLTKLRFLPTIGISFLFMKIAVATGHDVNYQKMLLLVFGIAAFLSDSIYSVVTEKTQDEINYARTLQLSPWQALWEVIIVGKLDKVVECVRSNFAMAWMMLATVENLCRSTGGIGVELQDLNRWFKFESIYAIQICILLTGIGLDYLLTKARFVFFPYAALNLKK